ncbi:MAG: GNAT family N-acetyltransferase [Bacteroidia bacterium]|nr:GNAT family N-acetyltransferase [Bacteroidia bacterium]
MEKDILNTSGLKRCDSGDTDFRALVQALDTDLQERNGEEQAFYAQYNGLEKIKQVVLACVEGEAVACGAFKPYEAGTVEIKRMFVKKDFRRRGLAGKVLGELEAWAAEEGYTSAVLETGKKQPEAIALYLRCGYRIIPNYGQYEGVENSVCMKKEW